MTLAQRVQRVCKDLQVQLAHKAHRVLWVKQGYKVLQVHKDRRVLQAHKAHRVLSVIQGRKVQSDYKDRRVLQAFKGSKGTMVTSVPLDLRVQKDL